MPSSLESRPFEDRFVAALTGAAASNPTGYRLREGVAAGARLAIYRNNVEAGMMAALHARFPVTAQLVGDAFFAGMMRAFMAAHPPASPVLMAYGSGLAEFLRHFSPVRALGYLADVAQLEWQRHDALHAADAVSLTPADFASIAPAVMPLLRFDFHPALRLVTSDYPIVTIWRANTQSTSPAPISADLPAETALILRPALHTEIHALDMASALFHRRLLAGASLADAAVGGGFDLAAALARLIQAGAITGFHSGPDNPDRS